MIRKAIRADLPALFQISRTARAYMEKSGNTTQWEPGYPDNYLEGDIAKGDLYVLCGADGAPQAENSISGIKKRDNIFMCSFFTESELLMSAGVSAAWRNNDQP